MGLKTRDEVELETDRWDLHRFSGIVKRCGRGSEVRLLVRERRGDEKGGEARERVTVRRENNTA